MNYKMIVLDLDGTLTNQNKEITPKTKETLMRAQEQGKIVVLVNGSPSAMVLPALFCENFECLDDYASTAVFSSFLRILKYV